MWKIFVICVNFFPMHFITCEIFSYMWNNFVMHVNFKFHMHNRCYACEIFHMHVNTSRHVRVSMWISLGLVNYMQPLWTTFSWKCHECLVNKPWKAFHGPWKLQNLISCHATSSMAQHVFDSCSEGQHFLKSSKVSQLERTMLSFSLASNTSNTLEYSNQCWK